jgi:putative ABC transport system ATP-binding protein
MTRFQQPLIEFDCVSKIYGDGQARVNALTGVSFSVAAGEFIAILGPSGSGKSTCLNIMGCLDSPTRGICRLSGQDVAELGPSARARQRREYVGFVFQGFHLLGRATAQRNVELPLVYRGIGRAERAKRAKLALAQVGLAKRAHHLPSQLSGGQQQRVAIARAIVTRPALLIADEPTGAVDSKIGAAIMRMLSSLNSKLGITVVLVTHDASITDFAKRRLVFSDGRLVADEDLRARSDAA